tara:strand:- start:285 stop:563 length:279 start_codon:yes stop_codon:yes gene_type:complete
MFKPRNRYLRIERQPSEEETADNLGIILPQEYQAPTQTYEVVTILELSPDSKPYYKKGQKAVVLSQMIEEVEIEDEAVILILENHIIGVLGS